MKTITKINYHTPNFIEDENWLSWNFKFLFWDILNAFWINMIDIECGVIPWSKKALFEIIYENWDSKMININAAYLLKHWRKRFTNSAKDFQLLYI